MYQCIPTEGQAKLTQYVLHQNYGNMCMLVGTEFLLQDGLLENFLQYTREQSHVPGCVSHSLCCSALFNTPPSAFNMFSPFPPTKHATSRHFQPEKMVHLVDFLLSIFNLSFLPGFYHLTQKSTYLFFPFLAVEVSKQSEFQRNEKPRLQI